MNIKPSLNQLVLRKAFPLAIILYLTPQTSWAQSFDIYCISDPNGVLSCQRQNGINIDCILNSDGTYACRSSQGQTFNCISDSRGVTSCQKSGDFSGINSTTDCTMLGDGFSTCNEPLPSLPSSQWQFNSPVIRDTRFEIPSVIRSFELSPN